MIRKITFLLVLTSIFLAPIISGQDLAVYVPRTEHEEPNPSRPKTVNGGNINITIPTDVDQSVSFWYKRDQAAEILSNDPSRNAGLLISGWYLEERTISISNNVVPDDSQWHYFLLTFKAQGNNQRYNLYIDGNQTSIATGTIGEFQRIRNTINIGAGYGGGGTIFKYQTSIPFLFDDATFWSAADQEILDIFTDVSFYGKNRLDLTHPKILKHHDCNTQSTRPEYAQDTTNFQTRATISNNFYRFSTANPVLQAVSGDRRTKILVNVESDYVTQISPPVGTNLEDYDATGVSVVTFSAPEFIYLDRFGNEIGTSDDDVSTFIENSYARAVNIGYAVQVGARPDTLGTSRFFTQPATENTTVIWKWKVQHAVIIDAATDNIDGLDVLPGSPGLDVQGQAVANVQRYWVDAGTTVNATIDSVIDTDDAAGSIRFRTTGFTAENKPGHSDRYISFAGASDHLRADDTRIEARRNFTIEFWARRDPTDLGTASSVIEISDSWFGFDANDKIRFGKSGGTGFPTVQADTEWHHWAFQFDSAADEARVYRDGEVVWTVAEDFSSWNFNSERRITIGGARTVTDSTTTTRFPYRGDLNNLRIWKTARTQEEIIDSMNVAEFGEQEDLDLEMTFDANDDEGTPYGRAAQLFGPDSRIDVGTLDLPTNYTLEALVRFPLPDNFDGHSLFYAGNAPLGHFALIPGSGIHTNKLVVESSNRFWPSQVNVGFFPPGWHRISVSSGSSGTYFHVSALPLPSPAAAKLESDLTSIGNNTAGISRPIGFIDDVRIWDSALNASEIAAMADGPIVGNEAGLLAYYTFDDGTANDVSGNGNHGTFMNGAFAERGMTSTDSSRTFFKLMNYEQFFDGSQPSNSELLTFFPSFHRTVRDSDVSGGARYSTGAFTLDRWVRLSWTFEKQYLLKLDAQPAEAPFTSMPFLEIDGVLHQGINPEGIWVRDFADVRIGTQYRTDDRCSTLDNITSQTGQFSTLTMDTVTDGTGTGGVVTRELHIPGVTSAGNVVFNFADTYFRAEIPLGSSLDLATIDAQLVPDLCDGAVLSSLTAPEVIEQSQRASASEGDPFAFETLNGRLFPVKPGQFLLRWQDENDPTKTYNIEIVSGFPTETEPFTWDRENDAGVRDIVSDNYVNEVTLADVAASFPASPSAHYQHISNADVANIPPVALDPNDSDRWHFHRQSFATSVSYADESGNFFAPEAGKSVLLFSYRPDPTEVADGNTANEGYAVRIVESRDLASVTRPLDTLSTGTRTAVEFDGSDDHYLDLRGGNGGVFEPRLGVDRSVEFWCRRAIPDPAKPTADQIAYEQSGGTVAPGVSLRLGFRNSEHATPGSFFIQLDTVGSENHFTFEIPDATVDHGWHHWAINFTSGNDIGVYMDGRLIGTANHSLLFDQNQFDKLTLGRSLEVPFNRLGQLDNFRLWGRVLSLTDIRDGMLREDPTNPVGVQINGTFDVAPNGIRLPHTGPNLSNRFFAPTAAIASAMLVQSADANPEVASALASKLDTTSFNSGFATKAISNFNPLIYTRDAEVGTWGQLFPTNWSGAFPSSQALEVVYYENPFRAHITSSTTLHPNVAWPYTALAYDDVDFPASGVHKDNRIYISSRLGSEGVDATGIDQPIYDPATTEDLTIYNQPDRSESGFNPNEEHAIVADSIKDILTGDNTFNLSQDAAFALQNQLNVTDRASATTYTSDPWVLVQFTDLTTGLPDMAAYKVETTRTAGDLFPVLDPETNAPVDALGVPVAQPADPSYDFDYPAFAGDPLVPPYPLNLVIGNLTLQESWGGNTSTASVSQRTLWNDRARNFWTVSGGGEYFFRYWYPFRDDFWFDLDNNGENDLDISTPIAWLPADDTTFLADSDPDTSGLDEQTQPVNINYTSYWRDDYPILKRGETLTYAGGENKAENTADEGLPALVNFASAQVVYDSANPPMLTNEDTLDLYSARVVRPLDRFEMPLARDEMPTDLNPANTEKVMTDGGRWYFKDLTGSLQKRFYYDSVSGLLTFRGRLNDLEAGDPALSSTPVSLFVLEPNVMSVDEYNELIALGSGFGQWEFSIVELFFATQDPHDIDDSPTVSVQEYFSGVEPADTTSISGPAPYYTLANDGTATATDDSTLESAYTALGHTVSTSDLHAFRQLDSLGTGAALVPNPDVLTDSSGTPKYITLVENNHPETEGAISLHIVEIGQDRFRGAIKLVEAQDIFDEKVNLQHNGDFGGNTADVYYQWWVRDVTSIDNANLPTEDPKWQLYTQGLGLHKIAFAGRPDVSLADKLFYVRYGQRDELDDISGESNTVTDDPETAAVTDDSWRLVDLDDDSDTYARATGEEVPFQWAGAFNSPQLQADGSRRFVPQLIMGWVKRVLDRVNPYEARYTDFYNNDSPATYSSMIQIAGKPYIGKVALNSDKDVIENVGLIELYETVLARASELTLDTGLATDGTDLALLLAATRLATLYEVLARDAFTDAQDPTVAVTDEELFNSDLNNVSSFVHAFYNQQSSLQHEELALLRGTDFVTAYPAYNRLFWNYAKGLGEAAYNANYNIHDANNDGFINEFDGAILYPQGHGDAWGHFLSANKMHYTLLQNLGFDWQRNPELYSLLDNVIEVDYLDEKSFARIAAAKARAGKQIVDASFRLAYTNNPDAQTHGYSDPDAARAWGVSEWAKRTSHGAYFDYLVGNALVPAESDEAEENLERIDRETNAAELSEIAATLRATQDSLDRANRGHNPLGFDADALAFDLDPSSGTSHFEQIYERAVAASQNALTALDLASRENNKLRRIADDTQALQVDAVRQDLDYRNRLIQIFGTPYSGKIGPGEVYPDGYDGPDTLLYFYVDNNTVDDLLPDQADDYETLVLNRIQQDRKGHTDVAFDPKFFFHNAARYEKVGNTDNTVRNLFDDYLLNVNKEAPEVSLDIEIDRTASFAFKAPDDWGSRRAYGELQQSIAALLAQEAAIDTSLEDYRAFVQQLRILHQRVEDQLLTQEIRKETRFTINATTKSIKATGAVILGLGLWADWAAKKIEKDTKSLAELYPRVVGLSNDTTFAVRGGLTLAGANFNSWWRWIGVNAKQGLSVIGSLTDALESQRDSRLQLNEEYLELIETLKALSLELAREESMRHAIAQRIADYDLKYQQVISTQAEGFRLLDEREAFNKQLAASVQRNRYSDMIFRLGRDETLTKYQDALDTSLRYTWLAAKAYDYETGLAEGDPAAATTFLDNIPKTRQLGLWNSGQPSTGEGGIASILAQLKANFDTLEGQLGINNPQLETGLLSLRDSHFGVKRNNNESDTRWTRTIKATRVEDLNSVPEFRRYCRPFADANDGAQPGLVIDFATDITPGNNVFGRPLAAGDHAYSSANFATKIKSVGVWFENYAAAGLSTSPRVYLVPAGNDILRLSGDNSTATRMWNIVEQRIPSPFAINTEHLGDPGFIPSTSSLDGSFADIRRLGDFRAHHIAPGTAVDTDQMHSSSRLFGRSVWNTRWLLIIPGATLHANPELGLEQFATDVTDIKLLFETYSHEGN